MCQENLQRSTGELNWINDSKSISEHLPHSMPYVCEFVCVCACVCLGLFFRHIGTLWSKDLYTDVAAWHKIMCVRVFVCLCVCVSVCVRACLCVCDDLASAYNLNVNYNVKHASHASHIDRLTPLEICFSVCVCVCVWIRSLSWHQQCWQTGPKSPRLLMLLSPTIR